MELAIQIRHRVAKPLYAPWCRVRSALTLLQPRLPVNGSVSLSYLKLQPAPLYSLAPCDMAHAHMQCCQATTAVLANDVLIA